MGAPQALSAVVAGIAATAVVLAGAGAVDVAAARPAAAASPEVVKPGGTSAAGVAAREAAEAATADAQRAAGEQPSGDTPAPPPTPPVEVDPQQQALDAASAAAVKGDKPVEVAALTGEQSLTTANPDGTFTTSTSTQPVRFQDANGAWREVDLTLTPAPGGGQEPVAAGPDAASIAASAGAQAVVSVGAGEGEVTWRQVDATDVPVVTVAEPAPEDPPAPPADPSQSVAKKAAGKQAPAATKPPKPPKDPKAAKVKKPKKAKFTDALPGGRDVVLEPTAKGAKESVVVPDRASADAHPFYRDVFTLPAGAVAKDADATGRAVVFTAADGSALGSFGGGVVTDASTNAVGENASTPALVRLVSQVGDQVTVEVSADPAWWKDAARAFPVIIDPAWTSGAYSGQVETSNDSWDSYVDSAFPTFTQGRSDTTNLKVGTRDVGGGRLGEGQSLVYFNMPDLEGSSNLVTSAWMSLNNTYSSTCTANPITIVASDGGWNPDTVTWNNRPHRFGLVDVEVLRPRLHLGVVYGACVGVVRHHPHRPALVQRHF